MIIRQIYTTFVTTDHPSKTMKDQIDIFEKESECDYKGEHYSVRDNGAVMRHPKNGHRPRPLDNIWTFGKKNEKKGYMFLGSALVHQIVATAFYGPPESSTMVVDHKDTNKCNNRAENLRWLTRLENALNNPITRRRIIICCGSISAFIDNPALLREDPSDPNTKWMRTVTKEEAERCRKHLELWAAEDKMPVGKGLGEWIYSKPVPQTPDKDEKAFECKDSLTPGAKQRNWKIPTEFPLCPSLPVADNPLKVYLANLKSGAVFTKTERYQSLIHKADISEDGNTLAVISSQPDGVKPFALTTITFEDGCYIHTSGHTYFSEEGATKYYTLALGREWTGGDVFDDHC